jgi:hypothetical protein
VQLEKKARQEDKKEGGGKEKEKGRKGGQHKTEDAFARVLKLQDEEEEEEWGQMLTVIGCTLKVGVREGWSHMGGHTWP